MSDLLIQIGLSNALFSLVLALLAVAVGLTFKRPQLVHLLWLLVFVKLVTPPVVKIPVAPASEAAAPAALAIDQATPESSPAERIVYGAGMQTASPLVKIREVLSSNGKIWMQRVWLAGCIVVFLGSLVRAFRFNRLLVRESVTAPGEVQETAASIACRLELRKVPTIYTTSARLSPMVWWMGGKVRVVMPASMLECMDARQWRWILAHELGHVRRRDHLVRWLEWLACVGFWWNPVVWWAQRNLRATEEICCDALVMDRMNPRPHTYANSLLSAVEFFTEPALRPPVQASEINSGGFLERRFRMIVSQKTNHTKSRWYHAVTLLLALAIIPLGLAVAQDFEAVERRLGEGVAEGELSLEQALVMMEALWEVAEDEEWDDHDEEEEEDLDGWLESIGQELREAVEEGEMTGEEAWAEWQEIKAEEIAPRLEEAVEEGEMSEEEARAVWAGIERAEAGEKLKAAVERGELTEEEAWARWKAIEGKDEDPDDLFGWLESIGPKLKAVIDAGEISKEQAWAKWEHIKKHQVAPKLEAAVKSGKLSHKELHDIWGGIRKSEVGARLRSAVEKGEMSEAEARARWVEMFGEGDKDEDESDEEENEIEAWFLGVGERLEAAVDAGEMTVEAAWAKWYQMKEKQLGPKLRAAVKEGEMSEEEARAVWRHIEIVEALEKGEMTKEEAEAKWDSE